MAEGGSVAFDVHPVLSLNSSDSIYSFETEGGGANNEWGDFISPLAFLN
jgi:hypothetical protein